VIDFLVTLIRFLVGVPVIILAACFLIIILWPLELILGPICLLFAAIFMSREDIRNTVLNNYPRNVPREVIKMSKKIWEWILYDWVDDTE
jgi:hypothetical protein